MIRECTTTDTDIRPAPRLRRKRTIRGIRSELIDSSQIGQWLYDSGGPPNKMSGIGALLWYGVQHPGTKRKKPVNVDKLIKKWVPVVTGLATAHDKEALDDYESQIDELLSPLLTAPVAQLREFAPKLVAALKAEPLVPFLVWRAFEVWIERQVMPAKDEGVIALKKHLATEIAELVEPQIQGDLVQALIGALQWRSEGTLKEIKKALKAGGEAEAKPKMVGRQSCLFLTVKRGRGQRPAEIML